MLSEFRYIVVVSRKGEIKVGSKEVKGRGRRKEFYRKKQCQLVNSFSTERNTEIFYQVKILGKLSEMREKVRAIKKTFFSDLRRRNNYAKR